MRWRLVGREAELGSAITALREHPALALVGATGVGKTRLLAELASRLEAPDRPVFRAVATDATQTIPLSSFIRLLPLPPPQDPSLLLRGVLDQLAARRRADGLLVMVDDAHHLDNASLALLALLDDSPGIALALTVCTDHPIPAGLQAVLDGDRLVRHQVTPLDRGDLADLVAQVVSPADPDLVEEVWRITDGNPLIARELLAGLAPPLACADDGTWHTDGPLATSRLRELTRARLGHLPPDLHDALDLVAVGAPVPYEILAAAVSTDQLVGLHTAEVVETTPVGDEVMVRPAHPLYGEVFAAQAGEARRRNAYRRLVDAAGAAPAAADPLRVAVWQDQAGDRHDPGIALAGAQAALGRHDGATAETLITPALALLDGAGATVLGVALTQQGRYEEAESVLTSVHPTTDAELVEVTSLRAFNLAFGLDRPDEAADALARAAGAVEGGVLRGRLDAERGVLAGLRGDFGLARAAATTTIDNPETAGPALASAYVSLTLAQTMLGHCEAIEATAAAGVAAATACGAQVPYARDQILIMEATAQVVAGRVDDAIALAEGEVDRPGSSRLTATAWLDTMAIALATAGRLDDALAAARRAVDAAADDDPFRLATQAAALVGLVQGLRGDPAPAEDLSALPRRHPEPRTAVWLDRARAWAAAAGSHEEAATLAAKGGRAAVEGNHLAWGAMALHDAVRFGRPDVVVDDLTAVAAETRSAHLVETMAHHAWALAANATDQLDAVASAFAQHGAWLLAAEVGAQRARVLEDRRDHAGAARAALLSLVWEARCQRPASPALRLRPTAVSPRELQIAMDAARGLTSSDIAEHRFISVRTVDNHLGAVYRALDIGGRDDLSSLLGRHLRDQ